MGGFSNPIIGGDGALVYPSIHSPNFLTGIQGWTINKDGSAEFDNLTIRGSFHGTDFIINKDGTFFYGGAPAAGNLIASIASIGGIDGFGNTYLAGFTTYDIAGPVLFPVVNTNDGQIAFYVATSAGGTPHLLESITAIGATGGGGPIWSIMQLSGGLSINGSEVWYPPSGDAAGLTDRQEISGLLGTGYAVNLLPGMYFIDQPLTLATGARLLGSHGSQGTPEQGTTIKPGSSFAGASLITFAAASAEQEIGNLNLDASSLAASSVVGISASGIVVTGLYLHDLLILGAGLNQGVIGGGKGWWLQRVTVNGSSGTCFSFGSVSDTTWDRCHAIGGGATGFFIGNCANGKMIGCKAEFCTTGFNISAAWTTGNGAGGFQMTGCSTDRNKDNGTLIDATGTAPINIAGHMARRDGSTGGAWAGVTCNASTVPVSLTGLTTYVGVNDDGSGTNSPKYGFQIINASQNVDLHSGILLGATAALNDDGTNTNWFEGPFVLSGHGTTAAITWDDIDFLAASRIRANGLAGATASSRYAGATNGGAPVAGTFQTGDFIIDRVTPAIFVCTAGGSPGTWAAV